MRCDGEAFKALVDHLVDLRAQREKLTLSLHSIGSDVDRWRAVAERCQAELTAVPVPEAPSKPSMGAYATGVIGAGMLVSGLTLADLSGTERGVIALSGLTVVVIGSLWAGW